MLLFFGAVKEPICLTAPQKCKIDPAFEAIMVGFALHFVKNSVDFGTVVGGCSKTLTEFWNTPFNYAMILFKRNL